MDSFLLGVYGLIGAGTLALVVLFIYDDRDW